MQLYNSLLLSFILITAILLSSCKEDIDWAGREYPLVNTLGNPEATENGVMLSAELLVHGPSKIVDHGFVYSTHTDVTLNNSEVVSLGEISELRKFEAVASRSLEKDREYNVRGYVLTQDGKTVYANNVSFISPVSTPPVIKDFSPKEGRVGDTITLTVEGMSDVEINNRVFLGATRLFVVDRQEGRLTVLINDRARAGEHHLRISIGGLEGVSETTFLLKDR